MHVLSTAWFVACVGLILIATARQAGLGWWLIFPLSGYSAVVLVLLLSLYLFAIFRGMTLDPHLAREHPLTSSQQYMALYTVVPFLGAITGCLTGIGIESRAQLLYRAALGTFVSTFAGWVILDPLVAALETLLPASRHYRAQRLAREQAIRQAREQERQRILAEILQAEQAQERAWQQQVQGWAAELAAMIPKDRPLVLEPIRSRAIEIGAKAWRLGGLGCMRRLHQMIASMDAGPLPEYLDHWWDGIGAWRGPNP